jgi:hypothetical protein
MIVKFLLATVVAAMLATPILAKPNKHVKIRLLALKHSYERIAVDDTNLLIKEVDKAAAKGLEIKVIGKHSIDRDGEKVSLKDLPKVEEFLTEKFKIDAEYGDTLFLFTVGHGGRGGSLHNLTNRKEMMKAIASAAAKNKQRVLWWQLSCYASAHLPSITDLPKEQQEYLSIVASSSASNASPAYAEHEPIGEMLQALAGMGSNIDPDKNGTVSAKELKSFLNTTGRKRGHLFYALDLKDSVFGWKSLALLIPIVDRNEAQGKYEDDYIGVPD